MSNNINTIQPIKVYRGGKLDLQLTYVPVIKQKLTVLGSKIDYWFVHNKWPTHL